MKKVGVIFISGILALFVLSTSANALHYESTCSDDLRIRSGGYVYGTLNKFDVSYIAGYYVDSAYWCGKIYSVRDSVPDSGEVKIWRMNSQTWSESSNLETINAISYTDSTIDTLNSTIEGTVGCVDVTEIVRADVGASNSYSSLRLESEGYPVGTPNVVSNDEYNVIGVFDGNYRMINFNSTEYPPASKLIIEYSGIDVNTAPAWLNNKTKYADPIYDSTANYGFEVEWSDDSDANGYNFSYFEHNFTGILRNYTALRSGNTSYYNFTGLPAGTHSIRFYANDSVNAWNSTDLWYYSVGLGSCELALTLNGTDGYKEYEINTTAEFIADLDISGTVNLDSNYTGWAIQTGASPLTNYTFLTELGLWNMTGYFEGNANITKCFETHYFKVIPTTTTTTTTLQPIATGGIDYCALLWAQTNAILESNHNFCIDNSTLGRTITYTLTIDGNSTTIQTNSSETCAYGCDSITNSCSPDPFNLGVYVMGFLVSGLIILGVLMWLYKRV